MAFAVTEQDLYRDPRVVFFFVCLIHQCSGDPIRQLIWVHWIYLLKHFVSPSRCNKKETSISEHLLVINIDVLNRSYSKLQKPVPVSSLNFFLIVPPLTGLSSISAVYNTVIDLICPADMQCLSPSLYENRPCA